MTIDVPAIRRIPAAIIVLALAASLLRRCHRYHSRHRRVEYGAIGALVVAVEPDVRW